MPADAVSVTLPPLQKVVGPLAVIVGAAPTFTVWEALAEQPFRSLTVTLYVVVDAGDTVIDCVVAPVDHENDVPPFAVSVTLVPAHVDVGPVIVAVGAGLTVTTVGDDVALQLPLPTVTA